MKEIFNVNSERANDKKMPLKKKDSMSWAEFRGKLVPVDWLTKSSPGLPVSIAWD